MPGVGNKVGADVRALARQHTEMAVQTLADTAPNAESEQARPMAADKLLDRAWGKSPQALTGENGEGPAKVILEVLTGVPRSE